MIPPLDVEKGEASRELKQAVSGVRVGKVWVVMASTGEWSDRSEWPIHARLSQAAAEADVTSFTARCRAAEAQKPDYPQLDYTDPGWERAHASYDRKLAKLQKALAGCGGNMDATFFTYEVAVADTSERLPSPREANNV